VGIDRSADRLDECPAAVGEREPGGDPRRESARLCGRLYDVGAEPMLEIAPNLIRKLAPVESLSLCRGKYRVLRMIRQCAIR
jgi:hypothetical protein